MQLERGIMTVKATLTAIRATGATARFLDGEYRVNVPDGDENTSYYTDDAQDAILTAAAMTAARCSGCRLIFGPNPTAGNAPCPDCGDCDDCCWANHGGTYHGVVHQ